MRSFRCDDSQCGSGVGRGREPLWWPNLVSIFNSRHVLYKWSQRSGSEESNGQLPCLALYRKL